MRAIRTARRRALRALLLLLLGCLVVAVYAHVAPLPDPDPRIPPAGTVFVDRRGIVLQRDASEGLRIPVSLDRIAPIAVEATIAAEDGRFRIHPGVDPLAMARALLRLPWERSGASTITQQLARTLYLADSTEPLWVRKLHELSLALRLEAHRSKREILEEYLNSAYYGRGAYGIEAAARVYFGLSAAELDLARAAFLAGVPQLPSAYQDPTSPRARDRQAYVLDRLAAAGIISRQAAEAAKREPLEAGSPLPSPIGAEFVQYALAELRRTRPDLAARSDLVVETTLDAGLQLAAQRLAEGHVARLRDHGVTNAAVVVIDPTTGAIRAMVGNVEGDLNLALARRQPGSAVKPIVYAAALESGLTAATPLSDVPTLFETDEHRYGPWNADRSWHGPVPLRVALASSLNVPAVETLARIGADRVLELANALGLGLGEPERYGLALALGGGEVRLLDLTAAYGAFANGGSYLPPFAIVRVLDSKGNVLYERPRTEPRRAVSPAVAYILGDILSDPDARALGFGYGTPLELPFPAAVKTGTTTGFRDNWTVGFTGSFVVGVWVGNADGTAMENVTGLDGAAPLWRDVMLAAAKIFPLRWLDRPEDVVEARVCVPTGLRPGPDCPRVERELFLRGTEPTEVESFYARTQDGRLAVAARGSLAAWARRVGLGVASTPRARSVVVESPADGAAIWLAPEVGSREVLLHAVASGDVRRLEVRVDGELLAASDSAELKVPVILSPGPHVAVATATFSDGSTLSHTSTFEVFER